MIEAVHVLSRWPAVPTPNKPQIFVDLSWNFPLGPEALETNAAVPRARRAALKTHAAEEKAKRADAQVTMAPSMAGGMPGEMAGGVVGENGPKYGWCEVWMV